MQNHRLSLTQPTDTPVPDSHTILQELGYEQESVAIASREPVSPEAKEIAPEREAPALKACLEIEERIDVEESVVVGSNIPHHHNRGHEDAIVIMRDLSFEDG